MKDLWVNRNFKVMLLNKVLTPFNSKDYLYEIKFDGVRALCFVNKDSLTLISRNGNDISYLFPELDKIRELVSGNVIFDGEIVSLENGKPSFSKLSFRLHLKNERNIINESIYNPVGFVVFDILYENKNLIDKTLLERKEILNNYKENEVFVKSLVFDDGVKLFNLVKKKGLEGIVAKLKEGTYHINSRTSDFVKIKNINEGIFYICGYIDKTTNYVFSLLLCEKLDKKFIYVGRVNVSKKEPMYKKIIKEKSVSSIFDEVINGAIYVKPKYKCSVDFLEKSKNGHLRHPIFKGEIK